MSVPWTALVYDNTAATQTKKLFTALLSISCAIRLISFLMMSCLVCGLFLRTLSFRYPPQKIVRRVEILGIGDQGLSVWREMSLSHRKQRLRYSSVLVKVAVWNEVVPHFSSRAFEYLRHNFPWDRLISHQTNNPWPRSTPKISTCLTIFWGVTWKTGFVKTIHRQEKTSSENKSDGLHKKCSIELWKILLFELLLIQQHSAWNEHSISYWKRIVKHYWFYSKRIP